MMGSTTQQEEHIWTIRTGQRNGKAFMEKTPSRSRNHSMSVCRSTSKRQTSKTESEEFVLFEKDFICELQIKIDFCMISYYDEMVRFRTNGGCI
jgi:hypothetical protein